MWSFSILYFSGAFTKTEWYSLGDCCKNMDKLLEPFMLKMHSFSLDVQAVDLIIEYVIQSHRINTLRNIVKVFSSF